MHQEVFFVIDSYTSDREEPLACANPQICNCNEHGEVEHECTCGCREFGGMCQCAITETFNTLTIKLPSYFTSSTNPNKAVEILLVRLVDTETEIPIDGSAHSDLIMSNASADYYLSSVNLAYPVPRRFVIPDNKAVFNVWFKRINGKVVDLNPSNVRVIMEMNLIY